MSEAPHHHSMTGGGGGRNIVTAITTISTTTTVHSYKRIFSMSRRRRTNSSTLVLFQILIMLLMSLQHQQRFCSAGVLAKVPPQSCTQCTLFDYRTETCVQVTSYTDPLNHCPPICESETVCGPDGHCVLNVIPQCDCDFFTGQCTTSGGDASATTTTTTTTINSPTSQKEATPRAILYTESQHNQHLQILYTIGSCLLVVLAVFTVLIGAVLLQRRQTIANVQHHQRQLSSSSSQPFLTVQQIYEHLSSSRPSPKTQKPPISTSTYRSVAAAEDSSSEITQEGDQQV